MIVLSADHAIRDGEGLLALLDARGGRRRGRLVTLGIRPDRPETGYGYIHSGASSPASRRRCGVEAFVEKPDLETARTATCATAATTGTAGSSSGGPRRFSMRSGDTLRIRRGLEEIRASLGTEREDEVIRQVFAPARRHLDRLRGHGEDRPGAVIPADIGWSDVGSWTALDEVSPRDAAGNVISGNVIDIDSHDTMSTRTNGSSRRSGCAGLVVVDTPDATLVCTKERAQDVKKVVDRLRAAQVRRTPGAPHRVSPLGLVYGARGGRPLQDQAHSVDCPGDSLSLQLHHHRSEHWVVVAGTARVTNGEQVCDVHVNESSYIPMSTQHRLENRGKIPLQIIEVQNGEYLEEDDIVRLDDDYRRHDQRRRSLPDPGA